MKKFTRDERNKAVEKGKTLAIVLLCLCCLYLAAAVLGLYRGQVSIGSFWGRIKNTIGISQSTDNTTQNVVNTFWQFSRPLTVAAVSGEDRRIVKETDSDYNQIVEKINVTMRDIYSVGAEGILASSEEQWKTCLTENSVYVKFTAPRNTAFEGLFYGMPQSGIATAMESFGEMVLVPDKQLKSVLTVYLRDLSGDKIVRASLQSDTEILKNAIGGTVGKGREFSYGFETDTQGIASAFVVPVGEVETDNIIISAPRIYKTGINFTKATEVTTGLINIFGYNLNTIRQYEDANGALIYVGETGSLKLHPNGRMEYKALSESEGVAVAPGGLSSASAYSMIAGLSDILNRIYNISGINDENHNAELRITRFGQNGMTFDYFVDGIKVSMGDEAAVSAVVKNGVLTEFKMWIKVIEKTENRTVNPNAMTAVQEYLSSNPNSKTIDDGQLVYYYFGDDKETSAVWNIRGVF